MQIMAKKTSVLKIVLIVAVLAVITAGAAAAVYINFYKPAADTDVPFETETGAATAAATDDAPALQP